MTIFILSRLYNLNDLVIKEKTLIPFLILVVPNHLFPKAIVNKK